MMNNVSIHNRAHYKMKNNKQDNKLYKAECFHTRKYLGTLLYVLLMNSLVVRTKILFQFQPPSPPEYY
jgi:hypothetical protein